MRETDLQQQISPNSIIPSRTTVPLELRRQWTFWPNYTDINQASTAICVDGEIGTVNKTYREVIIYYHSLSVHCDLIRLNNKPIYLSVSCIYINVLM
jgi:hypothetical protein